MAAKNTKQEIDSRRKWCKDNGYQEVHASLAGLEFDYFVIPQSLNPSLQDFVFRCTGNPEDGYVFGISDSVPEEFRQYAVAHEFIEFNQIGLDTKGRCAQALEKELSLVPENIKVDYLNRRLNFFKNLVEFYKKNELPQNDIQEFECSLGKLEELTGER